MDNEPKRHHYIPQFILKNFVDDRGKLFYWDVNKKELIQSFTRYVFMSFHMYRDEINHTDNPTFIEKSLSVFEDDIAKIFQKLKSENEIVLLRKEMESLRIFLCLLSFRSNSRMEQYLQNRFDERTRSILKQFAVNADYADLWKREIEEISKCRSYQQIKNSSIIDPIIKQDLFNALEGYYMTFVDARGGDFFITDIYPTAEVYPLSNGLNIYLHYLYPITPTRLLLLNHIMFKPEAKQIMTGIKSVSKIKEDFVIPPKAEYVKGMLTHDENDKFSYRVRKVYSADVEYINSLLLNEAKVGIAFNNKSRIVSSVQRFNTYEGTKKTLSELEKVLLQ